MHLGTKIYGLAKGHKYVFDMKRLEFLSVCFCNSFVRFTVSKGGSFEFSRAKSKEFLLKKSIFKDFSRNQNFLFRLYCFT